MQAHPLKERGLEFALRKTTVQEFFRDFISDKAVLGIDKYHEWQGDKDVEVSPWQEVNQGVGATRVVRFVSSLEGLPVGPPTALVMQLQRVRVFGQHGMVLETSSSMENVPAGDCFTLEDRWVVRPLPASEAPTRTEAGALSIETSFEVRFVKSTLFKKIIESRSRADTLEYHRRWFEMIEKHVARRHHERSRTREQARRSSHPLRRTVENNAGRGEKTVGPPPCQTDQMGSFRPRSPCLHPRLLSPPPCAQYDAPGVPTVCASNGAANGRTVSPDCGAMAGHSFGADCLAGRVARDATGDPRPDLKVRARGSLRLVDLTSDSHATCVRYHGAARRVMRNVEAFSVFSPCSLEGGTCNDEVYIGTN
ncbi:hypothetical protein Naga_100016g6 [Nannochloropsis gaditana]|uniref:VASt domain-containing protein n=1 Tax=Nannochloropsis gaditana TaxID=72520 RepID=W7TNL4_9STRA|nr:hypothetical protein Naga_100016g6 [Nannochloropsis gaditana]